MTPSSQIAHYRIVDKLGEGGMGAVYRATDPKRNRDVAVKVLPEAFAQDAARMSRFEREARVLASLNHPNIKVTADGVVKILDFGLAKTGEEAAPARHWGGAGGAGASLRRAPACPVPGACSLCANIPWWAISAGGRDRDSAQPIRRVNRA